jgi:hypothetical protein
VPPPPFRFAGYAFTTLTPQLGVVPPPIPGGQPLVLADIPGLVAGAHTVRGRARMWVLACASRSSIPSALPDDGIRPRAEALYNALCMCVFRVCALSYIVWASWRAARFSGVLPQCTAGRRCRGCAAPCSLACLPPSTLPPSPYINASHFSAPVPRRTAVSATASCAT